jgi:mevalonate kinase
MLFGEYAVLEGGLALALALDRRISVRAWREDGDGADVRSDLLPEGRRQVSEEALERCPHPVLRFVWPLVQAACRRRPGRLCVDFQASFPPVWGLGSSSASTLAAAAALRALDGLDHGPVALFDEVVERQRDVQGAASGYDVATQLVGGCALFRPGSPPTLERPAKGAEAWVWRVAWTGDKVSTGSMIRDVRRRHPVGAPIYGRIAALAEEALSLLGCEDREGVADALTRGQRLLEELGASPAWATDTVNRLVEADGVRGARLSGAGGGDCVVLLADDPEAAAAAVARTGLTLLDLTVDPVGLIVAGGEA